MRLSLILCWLLWSVSAYGQQIRQQSYWMRLYGRLRFSDKWTLHLETDERRLTRPDRQLQIIAHAHLHRRLGQRWDVAWGQTFSAVARSVLRVPEWRFFQEGTYATKVGERGQLSHRVRIDWRWIRQANADELLDDYRFRVRFRYRPQFDWRPNDRWTLKTNQEVMIHDDAFDQYRFYAAAERRWKKNWAVEIGYLKLIQRRNNNPGLLNQDIVRLTLFKTFIVN